MRGIRRLRPVAALLVAGWLGGCVAASYAGTWKGKPRDGYHVARVSISRDEFPCSGQVETQNGSGQSHLVDVTWTVENGRLVGLQSAGSSTKVAEVVLAAGQLSGKVTSPMSVGGVKELSFNGFQRSALE